MNASTRTVDLAGVSVRLTAQTPDLTTCVEWQVGPLPLTEAEPDLLIDLVTAVPAPPVDPPAHRDGPVAVWTTEQSLFLSHDRGGAAHLTLTDGGAGHLVLGADPGPDDLWRVVRQLLFSALSWFLDRRDLLVLHGGLVSSAGGAALLLGSTGSGKSTTALALHQSGWDLHGDDLVVVTGHGDRPMAFGVPKRMAVDPALALRVTGRHAAPAPALPGDERGRVMLPASTFTLGWRPLTAVFVTGHDDGDGRITPLPHADVLSAVGGSFLEAYDAGALRRNLRHLAAVAAVPGWQLYLASDPTVRMRRVVDLVESVMGAGAGQ